MDFIRGPLRSVGALLPTGVALSSFRAVLRNIALADLEGKRERTIVNAEALVIIGPCANGNVHRQLEKNFIAIIPRSFYANKLPGDGINGLSFSINRKPRRFAP